MQWLPDLRTHGPIVHEPLCAHQPIVGCGPGLRVPKPSGHGVGRVGLGQLRFTTRPHVQEGLVPHGDAGVACDPVFTFGTFIRLRSEWMSPHRRASTSVGHRSPVNRTVVSQLGR